MKKGDFKKSRFKNFKKKGIFCIILILILTLSLLVISLNKRGENIPITGRASLTGNVSANVIVTTTPISPGGGGGGGGGGEEPKTISMKIAVPSITTISTLGKTKFDINLNNDGNVDFNDVTISGYVIGDSKLLDAPATFDPSFIKLLQSGKNEHSSVTISITDPEILIYEVVINATSKTPVYNTYNRVFITFLEKNNSNIMKIIAFTEGLINDNVECVELKDMLNDAKKELEAGNIEEAGKKAQAAMEACKRTIEGLEKPQTTTPRADNTVRYIIITIVSAIVLGLVFNIYRQIRFRGWKNFFKRKN
jgi:hypothetical protein